MRTAVLAVIALCILLLSTTASAKFTLTEAQAAMPLARATASREITVRYNGTNPIFTPYDANLFSFIGVEMSEMMKIEDDCVFYERVTAFGTTDLSNIKINVIFNDCNDTRSANTMLEQLVAIGNNATNFNTSEELYLIAVAQPTSVDPVAVTGNDDEEDFPVVPVIVGTFGGLLCLFGIALIGMLLVFAVIVVILIVIVVVAAVIILGVGFLALGVGSVLKFVVYKKMEPPEAGDEDQDLWSEEEDF